MLTPFKRKVNPAKLIDTINYTTAKTQTTLRHGKPYITVFLRDGAITVKASELRGCY